MKFNTEIFQQTLLKFADQNVHCAYIALPVDLNLTQLNRIHERHNLYRHLRQKAFSNLLLFMSCENYAR